MTRIDEGFWVLPSVFLLYDGDGEIGIGLNWGPPGVSLCFATVAWGASRCCQGSGSGFGRCNGNDATRPWSVTRKKW